ncbi:MAG: ribosome silencing factor [Janthinobacterium lividum]
MTQPIKASVTKIDDVKLSPQDIINFLEDHKTEDAVLIDLTGKSSMAEAIIVASGRSQKHISITAELLKSYIKEKSNFSALIEGLHTSDWVLIDAGYIIIHLFKPETRSLYSLEKMWGDNDLLRKNN